MWLNPWILAAGLIFQLVACWWEDRVPPPGRQFEINNRKLHLYAIREGAIATELSYSNSNPTVVIDHSLGGIDGYFLIDRIAEFAPVCIYDRAGYGWSDTSFHQRSSEQIVQEMDALLSAANIPPPYILVGDSFGSYNVRLYAHHFPHKVVGIVLTDGLHEEAMLEMPWSLRILKLFFASGFMMSILGAAIGIVRLLGMLGIFELLKPELRQFSPEIRNRVKRSFYHPKHWLTMCREILALDISSRQLLAAPLPIDLPVVNIKSATFFKESIWNFYMPIKAADRLRDQMHEQLMKLSNNCIQIRADRSSHFIWVEQPDVILEAVKEILERTEKG
jgi:pimeloyl-ACP methyl ester carboxylesterase